MRRFSIENIISPSGAGNRIFWKSGRVYCFPNSNEGRWAPPPNPTVACNRAISPVPIQPVDPPPLRLGSAFGSAPAPARRRSGSHLPSSAPAQLRHSSAYRLHQKCRQKRMPHAQERRRKANNFIGLMRGQCMQHA